MRYLPKLVTGSVLLLSAVADAQMTPGGMGPMGGGMPGGGAQQPAGEEKKEGVATAAPKTPGLAPTLPTLPAAKSRRKRWRLLELDGYARMRSELFKNFNLGFKSDPAVGGTGGAPFPQPTSCSATLVTGHPCSNTIASSDLRLRLEPTFYLDEGTSVHVQADALDNLVLGSTPIDTSYAGIYSTTNRPPLGAFGTTQGSVIQGVNSDRPSLIVKRAWAEIALPLDGQLRAGRMPDQFGLGMYHNAGGADPINGTYNYDADFGDTVDRVSLSIGVPGITGLRATASIDWDLTRLVSNQTGANKGQEGHPFNLDPSSQTNGWVLMIQKAENAQEFRDAVDRGELMLDYGVYFKYQTQDWDQDPTGFTIGQNLDAQNHYVQRGFKAYTPDVWARLGVGPLLFEAEFVAQLGSIANLSDFGISAVTTNPTDTNPNNNMITSNAANIAKLGGVGRATWRGMDKRLALSLEGGFASGDQWSTTQNGSVVSPTNPSTPGVLNVGFANTLGDPNICNAQHTCTLTQFMFNKDYIIDLIFWRRLVTAVTNAAYVRPFVSYDVTKSITLKLWNVTSFALKPVATPGHDVFYGTEFDGDVGYHAGRLSAGLSAGVFLPGAAMNHPASTTTNGPDPYGFQTCTSTCDHANTGNASAAFALTGRLVLAF